MHTALDELQRITNNVENGYYSALCDVQIKDLKKKMYKNQYTTLVSIIRTNYTTITWSKHILPLILPAQPMIIN